MTSRNIIQALPHLDNAPVDLVNIRSAINTFNAIGRLAVNVFNSRTGHTPLSWLAGEKKENSYKDEIFHFTNIQKP